MHRFKYIPLFLFALGLIVSSCSGVKNKVRNISYVYKPDDQNLHNTIVRLDSAFFNAYNTCDLNLETYGAFFSDSIEFYHDKGGLMTSKKDIVESTRKFVCGKVTRELVPGSIEVYPIKDYGAVETGMHRFRNNTEKEGTPSEIGKFIVIWKKNGDEWKITRVVSLH